MSRPSPQILLLTHSADFFTIDRVAAAVEACGAQAIRLNTDEFPTNLRIAANPGSSSPRYSFEAEGKSWELSNFQSVWSRRIWDPKLPPNLDERFREGCIRESAAALKGFLGGLDHAHWINPRSADLRASDKWMQLDLAQSLGIQTPKTLVTNDPESVRRFFDKNAGAVITKMLTPLTVTMGRPSLFVRTSPVQLEDLEHLEGLAHSPMMFQEEIPKDMELRVVHVAGEFYVGEVDASSTQSGKTDWRAASTEEARWKHGSIPPVLAEQLRGFMTKLGLTFGAIDVIRKPDGDHVFLEVNPCGEWGMLERDLDLDISGALARALISETTECIAR